MHVVAQATSKAVELFWQIQHQLLPSKRSHDNNQFASIASVNVQYVAFNLVDGSVLATTCPFNRQQEAHGDSHHKSEFCRKFVGVPVVHEALSTCRLWRRWENALVSLG